MPEWLSDFFANGQEIHFATMIGRLFLAFLIGGAVAGLYWWAHRRHEALTWSFVSTLVLLAILLAMVTQVIGNNVARAFSLVGALSIVRFRTVVEDTRDTAFVIFSVVTGMAVGVGHLEVALAGLVVVGIASVVLRAQPSSDKGTTQGGVDESTPYWNLSVRIGVGHASEELLAPLFDRHFQVVHLLAAETGRQGAALDLTYQVKPSPASTPATIVKELNLLEGMQSVELRRV